MRTKNVSLLAVSLLLSAGPAVQAQLAGNPLLAPGDGVVYGPVRSDGTRVQAGTPNGRIAEFQVRGPDLHMHVTGDPGQLYFVMSSSDTRNWDFYDLAFEVAPGQFVLLSGEGGKAACGNKRFFKAERPRGPKPCDPYAHAQNLYQGIPYLHFLTGPQLTEAWEAASAVAAAYEGYNRIQNEIIECTRMLQECLARVEQLRNEAQGPEQAAQDAEAEYDRIEGEIDDIDDEIFDLIDQRKEAEKEVKKWQDLWTTGSGMIDDRKEQLKNTDDPDERASIQAEIDTIRSNMDSWMEKRDEAQDEVDDLKRQEADKRAEGEGRLPELDAAGEAANDAREAADEAWQKVQDEMDKCDQIRDDIRRKQGEAKEAKEALNEEARKFAAKRAELAAAGEAEKERRAAEAAAREEAETAAQEAERRRAEEAAAAERRRAELNLAAYQRWLQDIETMHGSGSYWAIVGAFLTSGGVELIGATAEGLPEFMRGAGAVNALSAATSGLLQGGWS